MIITLTKNIKNASLQIGDTAWYAPVGAGVLDGFASSTPTKIGTISAISGSSITISGTGLPEPSPNDFLMFSKNKEANNTSLIGYYADVKFVNNRTDKVELFSVGSEVSESSK